MKPYYLGQNLMLAGVAVLLLVLVLTMAGGMPFEWTGLATLVGFVIGWTGAVINLRAPLPEWENE